MAAQSNDEGADPSDDIKEQNIGQATTSDRADGCEEGSDKPSRDATKTQDLAKAGRDDMDPNAGQE